MKNILSTLTGLCALLFWGTITFAQTEPQVAIGETIVFPHQDSLNKTLERFGLRLIDFPEWATQCPKLKPSLPDRPYKNPVERVDSFEKFVVVKPDTLHNKTKDVNILWVHGLNGSKTSLYPPGYATQNGVQGANPFPARKAKSYGIQGDSKEQLYSENYGLTPAAFDVNHYAKNNIPVNERTPYDFVFGHSQGGLVAREYLRKIDQDTTNYSKLVHGLVTMGTPNNGAKILNNCRPNLGNKVPAFMEYACLSLTNALLTPKINSNFFTSLLISKSVETQFRSMVCDKLSSTIIPLTLSNYYKTTTLDYYVNSPFLTGYSNSSGHVQGLSEYASKVPIVQFYGQEEQPILWRFLSSTMDMGQEELELSADKFFSYSKDDQLQIKVQGMIDEFKASEEYEKERYEYHKRRQLLSIGILGARKMREAKENADAYYAGWKWLAEANEYYLTDLVGGKVVNSTLECRIIDNLTCSKTASIPSMDPLAKKIKVEYNFTSTTGQCTKESIGQLYQNYTHVTSSGSEFMGNCMGFRNTFPTWKNTYSYITNDGVVLAESAAHPIKTDIMANPFLTHKIVKMSKTNHEQMKNSIETKNALIDLYKGNHGYFFKIDQR